MTHKKFILFFFITVLFSFSTRAQTADEVLQKVRTKLEKVNDYEAKGTMKTDVVFIKAPVASVKIYFKRPNKLRIYNETGISFIPKGAININLNNLFMDGPSAYDVIDVGKEANSNLRIIKLLPKNENSDVVLSTLYVDEASSLIKKSKTTTKDNGTYELEMTYGKYADYGLADKVIFSFNTKDYKLPKGVAFDYDDGTGKKDDSDKGKDKKGKVEITYASYNINKGVPDSVFQ